MSTKFRNRRKLSSMVITYNTKRRVKRKRQIQSEDAISDIQKEAQRVCNFCLSGEDCEIDFGMFLGKEDVTVHYFCLLLSSGLCQNTKPNDKKSILGFLLTDIKKEIKRGNRLKCCFCHEKGATIGCCIGSCKKAFHLNCGRQNGTLHQFFDSFQSYCPEHRLQQDVKAKLQLQKAGSHICPICLISVNSAKFPHSLVAPCCVRSHFHRKCLQQYAISAGKHYFKCPLCNCVKEFQSEMQKFGVYIPDQDASWEREPNAFHDLLERYDTCDALVCTCPQGKNFDADSGDYELFLCGWCGSAGSHLACGALIEKDDVLLCKDCAEIAEDIEKKSKKRKSCIAATSQQSLTVPGTSTRRRVGRPSRNSKLPSAGSSYSQVRLRSRQHLLVQ
ncbi:PHD finger protein 7-like isoform X2 [Physella acuta]|uniref:PHD finger protein 7-like isoform X2 n=1 Tax=Physella acuta TaxID=109671 RepID=UPI0027DC8CE4|nr:PHD finger protein 7-like isoform X2 [Physella acuta]